MSRKRKRQRAEPRRKTPPLILRHEESGERDAVLLDETFKTGSEPDGRSGRWLSTQIHCRIILSPGLKVTLKSRKRSNGKRLSVIEIAPYALGYFQPAEKNNESIDIC
jgi:hypothetical protein